MSEINILGRTAERVWRRRHPEWARPRDGHELPHYHLPLAGAPRFVLDRVAFKAGRRLGAGQPWITRESRELLDRLLKSTDRGLEFGPGETTLYFAPRVEHVTSVEGFEHWHALLEQRLEEHGVDNVSLYLASAEEHGYETDAHRDSYVHACPELAGQSLDFVLVDGEYRDDCAHRAIGLLRPGGMLILDNAELYLPTTTRSPWHADRPISAGWREFVELTQDWRCVWTTNGVWDTAIWFKP